MDTSKIVHIKTPAPVPFWWDRKNDRYEIRVLPSCKLDDPLAQKIWEALLKDPEPEIKKPRGRRQMEMLFWKVVCRLLRSERDRMGSWFDVLSEFANEVGPWLEAVLPVLF